VRVFTGRSPEHGWQSTNTVIEIVNGRGKQHDVMVDTGLTMEVKPPRSHVNLLILRLVADESRLPTGCCKVWKATAAERRIVHPRSEVTEAYRLFRLRPRWRRV